VDVRPKARFLPPVHPQATDLSQDGAAARKGREALERDAPHVACAGYEALLLDDIQRGQCCRRTERALFVRVATEGPFGAQVQG